MSHDTWLVSLLVKLAVMASIASILARSNRFKSILLQEKRTMMQRLELALWLSIVFAASVLLRRRIRLHAAARRRRRAGRPAARYRTRAGSYLAVYPAVRFLSLL